MAARTNHARHMTRAYLLEPFRCCTVPELITGSTEWYGLPSQQPCLTCATFIGSGQLPYLSKISSTPSISYSCSLQNRRICRCGVHKWRKGMASLVLASLCCCRTGEDQYCTRLESLMYDIQGGYVMCAETESYRVSTKGLLAH